MSLIQAVYTVGTATQTVVAPTNDYAEYVLKNIQPVDAGEYAREGMVYAFFSRRDITSGTTEDLVFTTGATGAQLDYFQLVSEQSSIYSQIIEGATVTTTGPAIQAYNLNRNHSDAHETQIHVAATVSGGTAVQSEFVTASNQGGGAISSQKVITLKPNTNYVFRATNVGNQTTSWYSQVAFSEHYNGYNRIWLGTINNSFVLDAGEELQMVLPPNETINASSLVDGNKLSVMRRE